MLILTKCILREQQSHDGLTKPCLSCLRVFVDGVQINWAVTLYTRFVEESNRFLKEKISNTENRWYLLTTTILFNKITVIFGEQTWSRQF